MQPNNYLINIKYAEILYSTGSDNVDTLILSRKYYSHALTLQDDDSHNIGRALWGLLHTCKAIESLVKREDEKNTEIIKTCQAKLREIYGQQKKGSIGNMRIMQT